ncbi:cytochrome c biogenesis heme-transporting ATPase CcmA [Methylophilus sp. QUAN]|uniref:cytochrome c biogenesis heme-transporting ATPase CcmA n=1 Tax=Methylophilus sp. QUAN TaxID=2781020 RepID=UPI00188FD33E|nr:cytochrome c biogenesis heme-transporting ATPase CcmA [Methylophilus sp. QUAN]
MLELHSQKKSSLGSSPILEAVDLSCVRNNRQLFKSLSFKLRAGDMLHIRGHNGSGKSSLLRLLNGLNQPTSGHVLLLGRPLADLRNTLASRMIWIGHTPGIKATLTARENLEWLQSLHNRSASSEIPLALEKVGLRDFEDTPCHALSAGQQRRVALARLYLSNPASLWVLDEPFTCLDAEAIWQLEAHLETHCRNGGLVVLTTHHELNTRPHAYSGLDLRQYAS